MNNYTVTIFTPQELNHSSYIHTGLFELEKEGFLKTKVKLSLSKRLGTIRIVNNKILYTKQPHPKTSFYELEDKSSGNRIKFATDLYDASNSFSLFALENCDYIFKRNYEEQNIKLLPQNFKDKILPLGLTFKVISKNRKSSFKVLIGLFITNFIISIKLDRNLFKRTYKVLKNQFSHWKKFIKSSTLDDYEMKNSNIENYIFFQTRCFPNENQIDVLQIHEQRYRIIILLKRYFKEKFKGGLIPSKLANKKYHQAITNMSFDSYSYLNFIKNAKIVIYTRGLANSPAWKMAEYLSQGKVIIAEKLTSELPIPLTHGKEVLFFEKEEEIPTIIENTINNDELCISLGINARKYFEQNVNPKNNIKRIINLMLLK
jgi:hypothetical protein